MKKLAINCEPFTLETDRNMFDGEPFFCLTCERNVLSNGAARRKINAIWKRKAFLSNAWKIFLMRLDKHET